jgi:dipeptidyl aminopeptidase/acylaminoacyl peptidase
MRIPRLAAAALLASLHPAAANQPVTLRDLLRIVRLSDPHIAPDGKSVALVETRPDAEHDQGYSEIALVDVANHTIRPITRDRHHAASPRWSPTGTALAFLAPDSAKKLQIFVLPMIGGDPNQITHAKDDVVQFAFSPDGQQVAYVTTDPAPDRKGEDKYRDAFQVGNTDYLAREKPRPSHLWLVPAVGGNARRLTSGDWSLPIILPPGPPASPLKFSKDGKSIVFVRQASPATGDAFEARIQIIDTATGKIRDLTGATTLEGYPVLSPDGQTIAYWRNKDAKPWQEQDIWLAPFAGGPGHDISAALDRNVFGTWWTDGGKSLLVGANDLTSVALWKLPLEGAGPTAQPAPAQRIDLGGIMPASTFWVDADIGRHDEIAFIGQTATDPYELYLLSDLHAKPLALTNVNAGLANLTLGKSETVIWQGPGKTQLNGVLTYPPGYAQGTKYPLVLLIHGGPTANSRQRFSLFTQILAAQGWIVFEPNYRGSDSQGNAFYAAIYQDAGQGPGEDVMSGIKALQDRNLIDPDKIAVSGWSYGGFMTSWLIGHYPIWKAAVAGAAVTDWEGMYDLSDSNITTTEQPGGSPYVGDGLQRYRAQSPDESFTKIKTPTLVLCDVGDFRVPITQSYRLFRALRDNHVETEFYAYPVDGHFPGDPIRSMDVYQRWVDWLEKHLKK